MAEATPTDRSEPTPELADKLERQLDVWRRKLVATDRRQRLLYFKHTATSSLELIGPDAAAIAGLVDKRPARLFTLLSATDAEASVPDGTDRRMSGPAAAVPAHLRGPRPAGGIEVGTKRPAELEASLRRLDLLSRQIYADRGLWTLYVGLLMLQWIDPDDQKVVVSPIVLLPVELKRESRDRPYTVERTEDDLAINATLRLKLEELGLVLPDLAIDDLDVDGVRGTVDQLIADRPGWRVLDRAVLTTFSFQKEPIYRDLTDNQEAILVHPMVQLLGLGPDSPTAETLAFDPPDQGALDTMHPPEKMTSILDADSSQRVCIVSARDGQSFVMDGPPGTGKSQTIANVIVELMSAGKTVLFVSEKAAALDVVRNRLSGAGLGTFLFELHSHSATRKHVVTDLHTTLTRQVSTRSRFSVGDADALVAARRQLTDYAVAVNEVRHPLGRSVFGVLGRLGQLPSWTDGALPTDPHWRDLDDATFRRVIEHAGNLSRAWRPVLDGDDYFWRDLNRIDHSEYSLQEVVRTARSAAEAAGRLAVLAHAVDDDLGITLSASCADVARRTTLLRLADRSPDIPDTWLTTDDFDGLNSRIGDRHATARSLLLAQAELEAAVGPRWSEVDHAWKADLDALGQQRTWTPAPDRTALALPAVLQVLSSAPERLQATAADADRVGGLLGLPTGSLTVERAGAYAEIAGLSEATTRPQSGWLNPAVQQAVRESTRVLGPLTDLVRNREQAMREVFTEQALDLDLAGLSVRFRESHRGFGRFSQQARADRKALRSVSVRKKVDRRLLERLDDAAAWRTAHQELTAGEQRFATPLGPTYRRLETDFASIGDAVELAHRAVELAGADADFAGLAAQLAEGGSPDPNLTLVAQRLRASLRRWVDDVYQILQTPMNEIGHLSLADTAAWCTDRFSELDQPLGRVVAVAGLSGRDVSIAEVRSILDAASRRHQAVVDLDRTAVADESLLGPLYQRQGTDWEVLRSALDWANRVRDVLGGSLSSNVAARLSALTLDATQIDGRVKAWNDARDSLTGNFTGERGDGLRIELDADLDEAADLLGEMVDSGNRDISEWCSMRRESDELGRLHLQTVVRGVRTARTPADQVVGVIERAALLGWLDSTIGDDPRLQRYRAVDRDEWVSTFNRLDRQIIEQAHTLVAEKCGARRPKSLTGRQAQVIVREANKKSRHKPIRQLLAEVGPLATELKPCFMMSPLTVSMYLSPERRFDVVIFDEASQVLPSDAINCIYRGTQLLVAGDQKQLPPTDFFARSDEEPDADEEDIDSFQSVLDLCKAAGGLTSLPLSWHYRSQHEALITYSNYRFYDGRLNTFPGASFDNPDLGVELRVVEGQYRRSGARDNPVEAVKVAERVAYHLRNRPHLSLGVVTFSSAQEDAVRGAIDRMGRDNPALADVLEQHDRLDGFFVKNLESVQGDERDVIIFSIGYGPDEHGRFTMNFGPLNREGGWRRLNVAITRARRRVEIVSSFRARDIVQTNSEGVRHLRGYLDFAERGMPALAHDAPASLADAESVFEEEVAQLIRSWGYTAHTQVGAAGYRIDIGVLHPDRPGEYILSVECDGAAYHSARTARDRDRLREQVLRTLGWRVHRIWGISWWRDRTAQHRRLRQAIDDAVTAADGRPVEAPQPPTRRQDIEFEDIAADAVPEWAKPYEIAGDPPVERSFDAKSLEARPALRRYLEYVLDIEAPIHESVLMKRLRDDWDIGSVGSRIRQNAYAVLDRARVNGAEVVKDPSGFYRIAGRSGRAVRVPVDGVGSRTALQVPADELELAVTRAVIDAVITDKEQVTNYVARLFGWRRSGPDILNALQSAVSRLIGRGVLEQLTGGGLRASADAAGPAEV